MDVEWVWDGMQESYGRKRKLSRGGVCLDISLAIVICDFQQIHGGQQIALAAFLGMQTERHATGWSIRQRLILYRMTRMRPAHFFLTKASPLASPLRLRLPDRPVMLKISCLHEKALSSMY